jgi:hypothetical protein
MMKIKSLKQFNFKLQALLLCGICGGGILSSCSSEDIGNKTNSEVGKQLVLTINTAQPNGPQASALPNTLKNVKIGSRATTLHVTNSTEDQINRLTVGIFNSDGSTVRTIQELTSGDGTTSGTFKTDASTQKTTAAILTTSLADGDQIVVAANAPSGEFNGAKNVTDFEGRSLSISKALNTAKDGSSPTDAEATDNIPMYSGYGTGYTQTTHYTISKSGNDYTATVALQHQLAKITVSSVMVDFDQNGAYKSATFTPTAFFLINVPNDLTFSTVASTGTTSDLNQGYSSDSKVTSNPYLGYLETGDLSTVYTTALKYSNTNGADKADAINSVTPNYYFYTMPNSDATTNNTKLVIKGTFDPDGKGTSTSVVYYPVNINWKYGQTAGVDGGTAKTVNPNKNYNCSITIKTKGATSPYTTIDPEVASISVTVSKFDDVNQSTVFE